MRWLTIVGVFLIGNVFVVSGIETLFNEHLVAGLALVLLGAVALYASVLYVLRIRRRQPIAPIPDQSKEPIAYAIIGRKHKKPGR